MLASATGDMSAVRRASDSHAEYGWLLNRS